MTCIVGVIAKGDVYLGVDSASGDSKKYHDQVVGTRKLIFKQGMDAGIHFFLANGQYFRI